MSQDDQRNPWEQLADSFEEVERVTHFVAPDSPLGRAMAEAREVWAHPGYEPIAPETFTVTPIPVELDGE